MLRRHSSLALLALVAVVAACDSLSSPSGHSGTPVGIVLMNARTNGAGYTTYPKINFYSLGSAQFAFSSVNSDTCIVSAYDTTSPAGTNAPQLGAGAFVRTTLSGRVDSLYKNSTGDLTYHPTLASGIPFNPGDSLQLEVAGDLVGFPQFSGLAATAEPFAIGYPAFPTTGNAMLISWTPATRAGEAMYVQLLYNKGGGSNLNRQLFCDFADDGQGSVQPTLIAELQASTVPFALKAQRVVTALRNPVGGTIAYVNFISTFEVPTPVSP